MRLSLFIFSLSVAIFTTSWNDLQAERKGVGMPLCESFLRQAPDVDGVPSADPSLYIGKRVYVHKNASGEWSIRTERGGRLLFHASSLVLEDADFVVQKAIRSRANRTGRRIQHAGIVGTLKAFEPESFERRGWTEIDYRPQEMDRFETLSSETPVEGARRVFFEDGLRVFAVSLDIKEENDSDE